MQYRRASRPEETSKAIKDQHASHVETTQHGKKATPHQAYMDRNSLTHKLGDALKGITAPQP